MKAKVRKISRFINAYGGINFVISEIRKRGIPQLIDSLLGKRVRQAKYSYSEVILSWIYSNFCGAERLEDIKQYKTAFGYIPDLKIPSPDRLGSILKSFGTPIQKIDTDGSSNEFCSNPLFQNMLLSIILKLNLIDTTKQHTLDYDNVLIETEKCDSRKTYKLIPGYSPAVGFINELPVFIEGRNGNTTAKFRLAESLEMALNNLETKGIRIDRVRMDSASYQKKVIDLLSSRNIDFFIRAQQTGRLLSEIVDNAKWQDCTINFQEMQIADIEYSIKNDDKKYRLIITRNKEMRKKNISEITHDDFSYRAIITNNRAMSNIEVVKFYNQRGAIERNFDALLNDFNWRRIPFSFINQNVVFLILGAIAKVLYHHVIRRFKSKELNISPNFRLKKFIRNFIIVSSEWMRENGKWLLYLYTNKGYERELVF